MPIPINPAGRLSDNRGRESAIDISFLATHLPEIEKEASREVLTASDKDANVLMKIWLKADRVEKDTFKITPELEIDGSDVMRLKTKGLLTGKVDEVKLTPKGKTIVSTMALAESNKFLNEKKDKSYSEILASNDKRNKKGYRIPKYAADSHLLNLKTS